MDLTVPSFYPRFLSTVPTDALAIFEILFFLSLTVFIEFLKLLVLVELHFSEILSNQRFQATTEIYKWQSRLFNHSNKEIHRPKKQTH